MQTNAPAGGLLGAIQEDELRGVLVARADDREDFCFSFGGCRTDNRYGRIQAFALPVEVLSQRSHDDGLIALECNASAEICRIRTKQFEGEWR